MPPRSTTTRDRARARDTRRQSSCHICGQPIDYTLPHTDPRSLVEDHIIPIARGGPDTLDNLAAAHRDCNSLKRARLVAPIIRRSGTLS